MKKVLMIENVSDKLTVALGGIFGVTSGFISNNIVTDMFIKLCSTVLLAAIGAAVGAVIGFFMKKYLDKKFTKTK